MRTYFRALLAALILALLLVSGRAAGAASQEGSAPETVLVGYTRSVGDRELRQVATSLNATIVGVIPQIRVARLRVRPGYGQRALDHGPSLQGVEYVQREGRYRASVLPNDPRREEQWHLAKVGAPSAWSIAKGSAAFPIAVVDTGVDVGHPDLAGRVTAGRNFLPGATATNYNDDNGHGTHVAGIAAAATNNGAGVSGMSWNTPIIAVKVLDYYGNGDEGVIAQGIVWAVDRGAKVINLSFGSSAAATDPAVATLKKAVDYAVGKGALVVAAAGNSGASRLEYPAAFSNVLSVGATGPDDRLAPFSNYGSGLDIVAPGTFILSTTARSRSAYMVSSYQTTATYGYLDGTSMAAPMVAGAAAVVWSHMPTRTASQIHYRLTHTARDLSTTGYDSRTGWGRLDFLKAVRLYSSVRGVVKLSNGQAVPGAVVKLGNTGRTVTTDSTGKYAFTSVAQAYYSISVTKPGLGLAKIGLTLRDGVAHTVNLTLKSEGALTGPVRDYVSGKVLPGATLTVQNATLKATTNSSGSYTLWSLPPGTYKVTASKSGYASSTRLVTVEIGAVKWYGYSLKPQ